MCIVMLVGSDPASLEGIAQSLAGCGHRTCFAHSLAEAFELALAERPLVAVIQRDLLGGTASARRLPLAPGGGIVLYRRQGDEQQPSLPASLMRATIADLTLPLERQRLVALVQQVEARASRRAGPPSEHQTPPESHRAV